ncbi:MAG: KH domain-containing protein [Methanogenium sp.]|jgi:predicted RNA-binding protein YlqC (UPF0109 family)
MPTKEKDLEFVEFIVKQITENNDIKFDRRVDNMGVLITISAPREDTAKIIGRKGRTADAIRFLTRIIGFNNHSRVNIKINNPDASKETTEASK